MNAAVRRLPRVVSFFDLSVLASAAMGPAYSLASTMGPMIAAAAAAAPWALLALTAIMLCVAVAFSELSAAYPDAGSSYAWIERAFGRTAGAYGAWLLLLSNFFATLATAIPAGIYTLDLLAPGRSASPAWDAAVGAVWILGSAALLYAGIRPTALVTALALLFELAVLAAAAVAALVMPHPAHAVHVSAAPLAFSAYGFINAMVLGIWMSDGWEVSASASEETAQGQPRASGRGGITGLLVTSVILIVCMVAFLRLGSVTGFAAHADNALTYVAELLGGGAWRALIVGTVLISTCATLWTTLLYLSRSVYAMGRNGVLPAVLGELDARDEPFWALVWIAVIVTACELLAGFSPTAARALTLVLDASSVFLGLLFAGSALACIRLFAGDPAKRLTAVVVPAAGSVALFGVLGATIAGADNVLRGCAAAGIVLGFPFARLVKNGRRTPRPG